MTYYLSLYYPPSRCAKRIGQYYTAAQLSAAVVGLVSAGFQKMDGLGGLVGFQWMFLIYGLLAVILGVALLWWLPDRPLPPGEDKRKAKGWRRYLPRSKPALSGEDAKVHYADLTRVYHRPAWGWKDLSRVLLDWRIWPLVIMYFGVVGVGTSTLFLPTDIRKDNSPSRHRRPKLRHCHNSSHKPPPKQHNTKPPLRTNLANRSHRNPTDYTPLGPLPHPARPILRRALPRHNIRPPYHDVRRRRQHSLLGALWRAADRRLRARAYGAHYHDVDDGDLPAATRRSWCRGCHGAGLRAGEFGKYTYYVCALYRVASGCEG